MNTLMIWAFVRVTRVYCALGSLMGFVMGPQVAKVSWPLVNPYASPDRAHQVLAALVEGSHDMPSTNIFIYY